jgi:hypothetical protein
LPPLANSAIPTTPAIPANTSGLSNSPKRLNPPASPSSPMSPANSGKSVNLRSLVGTSPNAFNAGDPARIKLS